MTGKELGKIELVDVECIDGLESRISVHYKLSGSQGCWGVDDWSGWDKLVEVMKDAKVLSMTNLRGKPVEVVFQDNVLKSWRILVEVI